jgi:hypothetical protein
MYPDLAVKGSLMNTTFMELVEKAKKDRATMITRVEWPVDIAHQAAGILGSPTVHSRAGCHAGP